MPRRNYVPKSHRIHEKQRREISRVVYFNASEFKQVTDAANAARLPFSPYVRTAALGIKPRSRPSRLSAEAVRSLTKIGNNLNQLTRAANAGNFPIAHEIDEALAALLDAVRRIHETEV